jgi:hypothetical protein
MLDQLSMSFDQTPASEQEELKVRLGLHGWQTRKQLSLALGWPERQIRDVAESMGAEIVRGQKGFKLTKNITRDDLPAALQASDAAISQGKRMIRYGIALRKKLHQIIG